MSALRELIDEIVEAERRASSITRRLLAFSRRQARQERVLDLTRLVGDLGKVLRRLIGENIEVVLQHAGQIAPVHADPGQLEQVIINLAVNARDAMPAGGRLTITTSSLHVAAPPPGHGGRAGPCTLLEVADTGCGMTPEVKRHLFEPFFTTKPVGHGTGLGLPTVQGIVFQAGGWIEVDSELGRGTRVRVYLPTADASIGGTSSVDLPRPVAGSGTLLLAEDDDALRGLLADILHGWGFEVIPAADARAAIELLETHAGPLRLVIADVVMPGGSGVEIAGVARAIHPEARMLYMSGYPGPELDRLGLSSAEVAFLQKPFSPEVLAAKITSLLDGPT